MKTKVVMAAILLVISFTPRAALAWTDGCFCNFSDHSSELWKDASRGDPVVLDRQMACVTKAGSRLRHDPSRFREVVDCAVQQWKGRDGTSGVGSSDVFLHLLTDNPEAFFDTMSDNRRAFDEWLDEIDSLSFVDFRGPSTTGVEAKRQRYIHFLENTNIRRSESQQLRDKMLTRLKSITPRGID